MIEACIVYSLLMIVMILWGKSASARAKYHLNEHGELVQDRSFFVFECMAPLVLFAVVFGMRWNVGTDYLRYYSLYFSSNVWSSTQEDGFKGLIYVCQQLGLHYTVFFGICAFLQIFFFYYALKDERYLYAFLAFFLITTLQWFKWMNTIRQGISVCIFIYSIKFIVEKKLWKYILCIVAAMLFHKSSVILFVLYPIFRGGKDFFKNIPLQFALIGLALFININLRSTFGDYINNLMGQVSFLSERYENYDIEDAFRREDDLVSESGGTGIGYYLKLALCLVAVVYSKQLKSFYNSKRFLLIYNMFFLGIFFEYMFPPLQYLLKRPFEFFFPFKVIMLAYLAYYLMQQRTMNSTTVLGIVIVVSCALFIAFLRSANFLFYFQM